MSFPDGIDPKALSQWMDEQGLPRGEFEAVAPIGGGTQNIMLRFSRGGAEYVLRRPPLHKRRNSDSTMMREARVQAAIADTNVPHPRLVAACEDLDVIGAAFYLMEPVDGFNISQGFPKAIEESDTLRHHMGLSMTDGIARLGEVDYLAVSLDGHGKPEGYLERQVSRWRGQLEGYSEFEGYPGPDIPSVDEVAAWLEANRPTDYRAGILHGDYHVGNVMFRSDTGDLAAICDWELSTIGDPLLDLGALLSMATRNEDDPPNLASWPGFPSREEVLARYAETSTRSLDAIGWYEVLACYRLGIILEGTRARAFAGKASMDTADFLRQNTLALFDKATHRVRRVG